MNILLLKPYWPYPYNKGEYTYNRVWAPLCLANCAAILEKHKIKVKILDCHALRIMAKKVKDYLFGYDKVFITSSSLDKWQCPNLNLDTFLETTRCISSIIKECYIIGYHGTVEPERILDLTRAKAVIRGEPEFAVLEICQNNDLSKIKGISFKNNNRFILNPDRALIDLKTLPIPAYHLLDTKKYFYEILGKNFTLFEISRGCNYQCKFCNKIMYGKGLRAKSAKQVIEEVKTAIEEYNVKTAYFIDLDFLTNRKIVNQLCEFLIKKKYNFKWCCQTRPDSLDIETLREMKDAGCGLIHLGVESGIQQSLDYLGKNITIEEIRESVKICKQVGIKTLAFFLFGLPGETDEDRKQTFEFIKELNTEYISLHRISFYKGYKGIDILQKNIKYEAAINKFICQSLLKYYLSPSYLYRIDISDVLGGLKLLWSRMGTLK